MYFHLRSLRVPDIFVRAPAPNSPAFNRNPHLWSLRVDILFVWKWQQSFGTPGVCVSTLNITVGTHSNRTDNSSLSDNAALELVSSTISYRALKLMLWPRMCLAGSAWNGVPCIYSCEESIRGLLRWARDYYNYKISSWRMPTAEEKWKLQLFKKLLLVLLNHASVLLSLCTYSSAMPSTTAASNCSACAVADGIHLSGRAWKSPAMKALFLFSFCRSFVEQYYRRV